MARQHPAIEYVTYLGVRFAGMVFQMFPIDWNLATARLMARIWARIMPRHKKRAIDHLKLAYGDTLTSEQRERMALQSMQQMTMVAMETFFVTRLINEWTWPKYIRLRGIKPALDVLLRRKGAILLTGHYGSWELCGFTLATLGFPVTAVMRPLDNQYLNDHLMGVRAKRGLRLLFKKGVAQSADDILKNGGILAFIADQNAGRKGEFVDFFGVKASTYKSIALLAIQHEVPIVVGYARRTSPRFEYEVGVNRVIEPREWAEQKNELHWVTQEYTRAMEAFIREKPEQYLWMHRRWKSRPKNERNMGQVDSMKFET
jgi:KDO2-lipid IV(A) lauroyltransferase